MKIGLDKLPASPAGGYSQHLAKVLKQHASEHEYVVVDKSDNDIDLYHSFRIDLPFSVRLRRVPSVVTVQNLNFLRYPQLYSLPERIIRLYIYRRTLRAASRLITLSRTAREELSDRLSIDPSRIEVVMPLAALAPQREPDEAELEKVRRKYSLPENFILMLGTVEPRHNHEVVLEALRTSGVHAGAVICGRRTVWSERLLQFARERHLAARVDFIYELRPEDLPALFRLAKVFAYLPDAECEASIIPVVEAMRAGVPMILSDTQTNREAAGDAALYVASNAVDEVAAALENAVGDESFRSEMREREAKRAELFSEYAVAKRLIDIYNSL